MASFQPSITSNRQTQHDPLSKSLCSNPLSVRIDGKEFPKRCDSRLLEICSGCAELVLGDWRAILEDGVPKSLSDLEKTQVIFVTATAPTFGKVHSSENCSCGRNHSEEEQPEIAGTPIFFEAYNYPLQAQFNLHLPKLLDATIKRLRRLDPMMDYVAVRAFQRRGALHVHLLLRSLQASKLTPEIVLKQVELASTRPEGSTVQLRWGSQADARVVETSTSPDRFQKSLAYLLKDLNYKLRGIDSSKLPDKHPTTSHHRLLDKAARELTCKRCPTTSQPRGSFCPAYCHKNWGAHSVMVTVSRPNLRSGRPGWSLSGITREQLKARRQDFASEKAELLEEVKRTTPNACKHQFVFQSDTPFKPGFFESRLEKFKRSQATKLASRYHMLTPTNRVQKLGSPKARTVVSNLRLGDRELRRSLHRRSRRGQTRLRRTH